MWMLVVYGVVAIGIAIVALDLYIRNFMNQHMLIDAEKVDGAPHTDKAKLPTVIPYEDPIWGMVKAFWIIVSGQGKQLRSFTRMHENILKLENAKDSVGMFQSYFLGRAVVLAWHRDHVQTLLGKGYEKRFKKVQGFSEEFDKISKKSILVVEGDEWKEQRHVMGPAFHFDHIQGLVPYFLRVADQLVDRFAEESAGGKSVEVTPWFSRATMDAIGLGGFGFDFNSLSRDTQKRETMAYSVFIKEIENPMRMFRWYNALPFEFNRKFHGAVKHYQDFLGEIISAKRANPCTTPGKMDILDVLVQAADDHSGRSLTDEELIHNVNVFFIAGHETSAATLGFAMHMLEQHPDVQERLVAEIQEHVGTDVPTYEQIKKLEYMRWFLYETLRLYGPASAVMRQSICDQEFCGYQVKEGDLVMVSSFSLHRMPQYFPDPEKFDPERFSPENSRGRMYTYMPFSVGPRQCIGNNFAMLEMRLLLTRILQRFVVKPDPDTNVKFAPEMRVVLSVPEHHTLKLEARS